MISHDIGFVRRSFGRGLVAAWRNSSTPKDLSSGTFCSRPFNCIVVVLTVYTKGRDDSLSPKDDTAHGRHHLALPTAWFLSLHVLHRI